MTTNRPPPGAWGEPAPSKSSTDFDGVRDIPKFLLRNPDGSFKHPELIRPTPPANAWGDQ